MICSDVIILMAAGCLINNNSSFPVQMSKVKGMGREETGRSQASLLSRNVNVKLPPCHHP